MKQNSRLHSDLFAFSGFPRIMGGVLLALSLIAGSALADIATPPDATSGSAPASTSLAEGVRPDSPSLESATSPGYKVGPEDVLSIQVARFPQMDSEPLVLDDGSITVSRIGRVQVAGKTLAELQALLTQEYLKVLRDPRITVSIKAPRVDRVFVNGAVNQPGAVEYKEGYRVTEALAKAGGLKTRLDWCIATLSHRKGGTQSLHLSDIFQNPDSPDNAALKSGDTISITEIPPQQVFVTGAVAKPGVYDIREINPKAGSIGVVEALALAGGARDNAALSKAMIIRADHATAAISTTTAVLSSPSAGARVVPASGNPSRREEAVNLVGLNQARNNPAGASPNTDYPTAQLFPGDTLHIPDSNAKIVVLGKVRQPGTFPFPDNRPLTVSEALGLAGGPDAQAKTDEIGIIRSNGNDSPDPQKNVELIKVNLQQLIKKSDLTQNVELKPGDVVFVPERRKTDWFGKILPGLATVAQSIFWGTSLIR